jgi:hypothetical protein
LPALNLDSRFDLLEIMHLLPESKRPEELTRALEGDRSIESLTLGFADKLRSHECSN